MNYRITQVAPQLDDDEIEEALGAIRRNWLTEGPCAARFAEELRAATGSRHAVLAPNGTLGLFLALLALDLPRDSEILVPSFTFFASASAAVFAGLVPVFVDADPETFNLDVASMEALLTPRTRAVMPVHVYGHAAPMDEVMEFARRHDLAVVEDAAQGFDVRYRDRHVGTWGDVGMISFFADKTITTGEGAVVLTQRDDLHDRLRLLRNQGRPNQGTFVHPSLGMNFRITDLQCAVGLAQMRKAGCIVERKRANYRRYEKNLADVAGLRLLNVQPHSTFVPFRFFVLTEHREAITAALCAAGVQTRTFFYPLHLQPALARYARGPLPVAESLYARGICLPVHGGLTEADIDEVSETIRDTLAVLD